MNATEAEFEQGEAFTICGPLAMLSLQTNLRINQSFMNNRENTLSKVMGGVEVQWYGNVR
jgi:hypothetical protein